jgi:D-arabinose 1-dehydrogenase-like Zn-dependent alcohol dehydrogenase
MLALVVKGLSVVGNAGARTVSLKKMLEFSAKKNVKPQIEEFPLTQKGVTEAMQKLKDGKMRYRGVVVVQ